MGSGVKKNRGVSTWGRTKLLGYVADMERGANR